MSIDFIAPFDASLPDLTNEWLKEYVVQIEKGLREKNRTTCGTFEELHAAEDYAPRAWCIDGFENLV